MQQPLPSQSAVGKVPALKEPQLLEGRDGAIWLLWLEQRPHEQGRTTALIRRFGDVEATPTEVTPQPINLRSRVHDYGGGVLTAAEQNNGLTKPPDPSNGKLTFSSNPPKYAPDDALVPPSSELPSTESLFP